MIVRKRYSHQSLWVPASRLLWPERVTTACPQFDHVDTRQIQRKCLGENTFDLGATTLLFDVLSAKFQRELAKLNARHPVKGRFRSCVPQARRFD